MSRSRVIDGNDLARNIEVMHDDLLRHRKLVLALVSREDCHLGVAGENLLRVALPMPSSMKRHAGDDCQPGPNRWKTAKGVHELSFSRPDGALVTGGRSTRTTRS